ncbi:response regulator [Geobacter anodireducens]
MTRVLVAHENPALRTAVRQALACEPFQVLEAADGAGAYAAILEHRPRVAILDAALPGMFAFEICEAVKGSPATADIKIILIASIYDKAKYKRAPESLHGADDYLEKHHIPDELPARVHLLLAGTAPHCGGTHPKGVGGERIPENSGMPAGTPGSSLAGKPAMANMTGPVCRAGTIRRLPGSISRPAGLPGSSFRTLPSIIAISCGKESATAPFSSCLPRTWPKGVPSTRTGCPATSAPERLTWMRRSPSSSARSGKNSACN